ncbi:MAG: D-inositol-3-phosphate glycosyltransferase [Actinomycetota bacterium]|jgi:D-inositol-3-phosphate glycosyltransferase|nr:D-inositol-3-phosphate glycosyltransferase [Actinomycetota bacterium]
MNVYVRELCGALARAGVDCDIYTRSWQEGLPGVVAVEPGFRVHHVDAGPRAPLAVDDLVEHVDEFTAGVRLQLEGAFRPDLIHANYWLSGLSGHALKHQLELPLVSTFHTLARVKAEDPSDHHGERARAEAAIIGCSDAILALSRDEAAQLERLYHAVPERIEIVPPGVDHRLFSPGDKAAARAAIGVDMAVTGADPPSAAAPLLLFVGRIQPLKGADVAVRTLAQLDHPDARLVVVGGPSGPDGEPELRRVHALVDELGLSARVQFVDPRPHEELTNYYRAADVCLVPSRSESFGLVALEAAACGTPVVAAAVGGLNTLVVPGITGFLVDGRDPAGYAAYVTKLLDDPDLAALVGAQAAALARRYRWSIAAGRLRRLYADLTARRLVECS